MAQSRNVSYPGNCAHIEPPNLYADVALFPAGHSRAEPVNLALAGLVPGLLAGLQRPHEPPSIFRTSIVPVPVVTTGSSAANARNSSSSLASTTPRPHEPLLSSTGPKITI